jgi:hypothetical protein
MLGVDGSQDAATRGKKEEDMTNETTRTNDPRRFARSLPETEDRKPKTENLIFTSLVALLATVALLSPWSHGPTRANADDPNAEPSNALPVVEGFEPAVAEGGVQPAAPQLLGGVTVRAWLAKDEAGAASILVELRGSAAGKTTVRCRVALQLLKFPESSMMMRMLPEPEVEELLGKDLNETLAAGQVRIVAIPVPADRLPAPPDPESMSLTHGQITVEALGDA